MIEGKVHKRNGRLTTIDEEALTDDAARTMSDLRQKAGL